MPPSASSQPIQDSTVDPAVRGFLHQSASASGDGLILTHGAGANCQSALLTGLATVLCDSGLTVLRCDLPFRQLRPFGPPSRGSAERDQQGLRRAIEWMRQRVRGRVFVGGHSYGGRQASMLAASDLELVDGLLLLSYPLHPPGRPTQLRTAHFANLRTPALFVSGTKDEFGTVEEITKSLVLIPARTELLTIDGVGHPLLPKRGADAVLNTIAKVFTTMFK